MINFQKSTRTFNKMAASHIPPSYDSFCVCICDFAKLVLNLTKEKKELHAPPSSLEIEKIYSVAIIEIDIQSLSVDEEEAITEELCIGKNIPVKFKKLCYADLEKYNIINQTFQWNAKEQTKWDELMISVIVKHWFHAKNNQAFHNYPIQSDLCDETTFTTILERWLRDLPKLHVGRKPGDRIGIAGGGRSAVFAKPGGRIERIGVRVGPVGLEVALERQQVIGGLGGAIKKDHDEGDRTGTRTVCWFSLSIAVNEPFRPLSRL
ncbi:hypothetical protein BY996DRAFT_8399882 [Phakopsora pachyrhizi]|nr:hypothetical protein BY996DRAFT_8399882 [Phakopsora pachyrhizi]